MAASSSSFVFSAAQSLASSALAVALGYWVAIRSQDRQREVTARTAAAFLWRELAGLTTHARARAPNLVTPEHADSPLLLHALHERFAEELASRNADLAFAVIHVPESLARLQAALTPLATSRSTIRNFEDKETFYRRLLINPDAYEESYKSEARSALANRDKERENEAKQVQAYAPTYGEIIKHLEHVADRLRIESEKSISAPWSRRR